MMRAALLVGLLAAGLGGCIATTAPVAKTEAQVMTAWGEPQASYATADGTRYWFYATRQGEGPGQRWRVVVDANGQVQEQAQAFSTASFEALAGQRRDAVLHRMGPPHARQGGGEAAERWIYRFREGAEDLEAQLQFDVTGEVSQVQMHKDRFHRQHYAW